MAELVATSFIAIAVLLIAAVLLVAGWFMLAVCYLGQQTVQVIRQRQSN
jgi:uncharacterized membrane protein YqiK